MSRFAFAFIALFAIGSFVLAVSAESEEAFLDTLVWDQELVDKINSDPTSPWKAGFNKRFEGLTKREAYKLFSYGVTPKQRPFPVSNFVAANVPDSFDSREQWPGCIHPIMDQGKCGSCWAFGCAEALSDRFCIQSNKTIDVVLSPQSLVSCDYYLEFACNGGQLLGAWYWAEHQGLLTLSCFPYTSGINGTVPKCTDRCYNGEPMKYYKAKSGTTSLHILEPSIQSAILKGGPVEGAFYVFEDFMSYTSGVYVRKSNKFLGGHAIKIIGWGHDSASNLDYWLIANSWGTGWGEQGYFRILRGQNECFIESNVVAADAAV